MLMSLASVTSHSDVAETDYTLPGVYDQPGHEPTLDNSVSTQTDMTAHYIQQLEQEVNNLTCDNVQLKSQLENTQMYGDNFQDSEKVQGKKGLPYLCILDHS